MTKAAEPHLHHFDEHAQAIAKRQYMQPSDGDVVGMFRRVADWVAGAEAPEARERWSAAFFELMASKRFCPGGRVLAGAGTQHGNVLNCFVQGATSSEPGSFEGVMEVAKKLALVTKVGGGNGVNLDVHPPRSRQPRRDAAVRGWAYMSASHPDVEDFVRGLMRPPTQPDGAKEPAAVRHWTKVVYGAVNPALARLAREHGVAVEGDLPEGVEPVADDMGAIIDAARGVVERAKLGLEPRIDLSGLRPEGSPILGSGGTSSGPVSFLFEIFDNFLEWANSGAEAAGPVATLRYCYSPVLRVVRQGGCLHPDTLIHTSRGTLRLRELVDPYGRGWHPQALSVATDEGWKESPEGFNNGVADTLKVRLENGLTLQGTPNHKLKVLHENGRREWVRFDELKAGDWAIQVLDQHTGTPVTLAPLDHVHHNAKEIRTPEVLSEELAFFLGYLWGDGFVSGNRIGVAVADGSPVLLEAPRLFRELFGLSVAMTRKPGDRSVIFVTRSAALVAWLARNGLCKGKATGLELPQAIRQAPRPVLGAFLRGLFEADGTITARMPQLSTASHRLAEDVLVALGGLGIPAKLVRYEPLAGRLSKREHYRVRVMTAKGLERYLERVGTLAGSRFEALRAMRPDLGRESSWPMPHARALLETALAELPAGAKGRPSPFTPVRKTLSRYARGERGLTATGYAALLGTADAGPLLPDFDFGEYYVPVRSVEPGGPSLTLDLCVEENHTYLAGGVVTHNTRRGAGMATISIDHPDVLDFLTAKDLDREAAEGDISTFNISILATERFWETLEADGLWPLEPRSVVGKYRLEPAGSEYVGQLPGLGAAGEEKAVPVYGEGVPARWLWREVALHAWSTGEPGLIFIDRVNEHSALRELGPRYEIKSTNPCFVGDTRIPTEHGLLPIAELVGWHDLGKANGGFQNFLIATDNRAPLGGEGSPGSSRGVTARRAVRAFPTGTRPVVRLETREGFSLTLTPDHRLLTPEGYREAGRLEPGDRVLVQSGEGLWGKEATLPQAALTVARVRVATAGSNGFSKGRSDVREQYANLPTTWSRELGAVLGWLTGDGYLREDGVGFYFNATEFAEAGPVVERLRDWFGSGTLQRTRSNTYHLHFNKIPAEFFASLGVNAVRATEKRVPEPVFRAPREVVVGFLQGLFTTDGTVNRSDAAKYCSVRLASSSPALLEDVQLLLLNLGIFSRIYKRRPAGIKPLPDGKGGLKEYQVAAQYELVIGGESCTRFASFVGFLSQAKQEKLEGYIANKVRTNHTSAFIATIRQVNVPSEEVEVFDLTEPVTHSLIANGIISHNCGEIPLTVGEPCDLGAINLAAYVKNSSFDYKAFRADVRACVRFLDNVLDVNRFALEDNRQASEDLRRLGLGVMGLADALVKLGQRYDREDGRATIEAVMNAMREEAVAESERLGRERGNYPVFERHQEKMPHPPRRNVAVLTVAPTGTTSMLFGVSSGIEPIFSPFVWRKIGSEYKALVAPLFQELLEGFPPAPGFERVGRWDWDRVTDALSANHGTVDGLQWVPEVVRAVFVCAHDVPALDHVRMQGVVQRAFDATGFAANSLSKTVNMPNSATVADVEAAYAEAYRTGCKGITVYRDGSRQFQVLSTSKDEKKEAAKDEPPAEAAANALETRAPEPTVPAPQEAPLAPAFRPGRPVVERPTRLTGITDMVKLTDLTAGSKRTFLITTNQCDGKPVEVIVVSGRAGDEANADSEALGRVVSIALQYGVPADAIQKTLRGINGGLYGSYNGRLVASKADLIAVALESTAASGQVLPPEQPLLYPTLEGGAPAPGEVAPLFAPRAPEMKGERCPSCGSPGLVREEGCVKCQSCGYSKCG